MAVPHESWIISGIDTSNQARVHIGHNNNEYHEHHHYGDESQPSVAERRRAREDAILLSLSFPEMSAREGEIDSPCDDTFKWIFDEQVTEQERYHEKDTCNLMSRWLEHEHGMFFIVGKAGSGKSTLMRFLAGHEQTSTLLQAWATRQHRVLAVCAHYFWYSGTPLQYSQEGLWRSILYTIAKSDRNLASAIFADRACDDSQTPAQLRSQQWTRNDLTSALSLLVAQLKVQKVAVCLFIDGLDEYQGDEMMLIAELRQLLVSPYIKICASSRPRNLFEQAFGYEDYQWKLALHLLTQGDMVQLARTRLYADDAFRELVSCEDRRQDFVTAITDKSQGVFLWTVFVIGEMIRESHQAGTIDELEERLDALPTELGGKEGLYHRIVKRSDPRYKKYMARLLLVMLGAGHQIIFWEDVHFLYDDARNGTFATRECLDLDDKYRLAWDKKADEAAIQTWEAAGSDTSCRGLFLACNQGRSGAHPRGVNCQVHQVRLVEDTRRQIRKWCPDFVDTNDRMWPQFLHRSVREYLSLPDISREMTDLAGRTFDPVLTRCRLRLAHSRLKPGQREMGNFERDFIPMVARVGHERSDFVRAILPEFERIQDTKWGFISGKGVEGRNVLDGLWAKCLCLEYRRDIVLHDDFGISRSSQAHAWFLSLVARKRLVWYCEEHWSRIPTSDRQAIGTIIIAGLLFNRIGLAISRELADLVRCLLCSGVNPNTRYTWIKHSRLDNSALKVKLSLWEAYVETFPNVWRSRSEIDVWWALEMVQLLLYDGHADTKCCLPAGKQTLLSTLTFEPHHKIKWLNFQNYNWSMFAGRLHNLLDARGLLTPKERYVAREQGWISLPGTANSDRSLGSPINWLLDRPPRTSS
jgi:energy-coupling factor transporter ATP-binding protein EcfA2